MSEAAGPPAPQPERRTLRWLLGGQVALAAMLVLADLLPALPGLAAPSQAPALDQPTRPGDQTRRYRPRDPAQPGRGVDADMPRRLLAERRTIDDAPGLRLRGAVAPGDGARIAVEVARSGAEVVTLDSPGGSVADALEIGRAVREVGAATRLGEGDTCLSACPYIFVGGVTRSVADGARLGVHQHRFGESAVLPAFLAVEDMQRGQAEVLAHLDAMGIDLRLMGPAMATPSNEIYILSEGELRAWDVVTE